MRRMLIPLALALSALSSSGACRARADTPLAAAAAEGDLPTLRALLAARPDLEQADGNGVTALIWAARRGQLEAMHVLIAAGADVNGHDHAGNGWSVLMHAIHTNQPAAVHLLLESRADPNDRHSAMTPLIMAAGYGYTEMVKDLLDHGADPYAVAADGMTALSAAVGGAPDIDRFTVASCQTSTVKALLDRAPDLKLDSASFGGRWAIRFARLGHCTDVLALVSSPTARR